jgi:hypothetical protein
MNWKLALYVIGGLAFPGLWGWLTAKAFLWLGGHRLRLPRAAHEVPESTHPLDYQI